MFFQSTPPAIEEMEYVFLKVSPFKCGVMLYIWYLYVEFQRGVNNY